MHDGPRPGRVVARAVLFDLDGVLADSTAVVDHVWREWAQGRGLDPDEVARFSHGRPTIELMRRFAPETDARAETHRLEGREVELGAAVVGVRGALTLVASLPEGSWAIVTSGTRPLARRRIEAVGVAAPEVLITADDVARGKPEPEGYLAAASLLGAQPADAVVIEDAPAGIAAARAAGMQVIAVTTTYPGADLREADFTVSSLEEIRLGDVRRAHEGLPRLRLDILGAGA